MLTLRCSSHASACSARFVSRSRLAGVGKAEAAAQEQSGETTGEGLSTASTAVQVSKPRRQSIQQHMLPGKQSTLVVLPALCLS